MSSTAVSEVIVRDDVNVKPSNTWPFFNWVGEQAGNLMTLGFIVMVIFLTWGIINWVGGSSSDNHRKVVGGKWMVFGSIAGAVAIAAAPQIINWSSHQNPIS
ncbi:hypothetical protein [Leifsonia shinshuensis]|uniref:Uncharacterized protein n=1 Tax=Leifsonia shinshuensis TaxID=150026 RepID=A0A7G6YHD5_9MICO|nr:hypothetical protein [Leifsonia shinshuensis]QNE37900.1 hypothetical protein F1C12_21690 [Leifsonia shinshuensis]